MNRSAETSTAKAAGIHLWYTQSYRLNARCRLRIHQSESVRVLLKTSAAYYVGSRRRSLYIISPRQSLQAAWKRSPTCCLLAEPNFASLMCTFVGLPQSCNRNCLMCWGYAVDSASIPGWMLCSRLQPFCTQC